MCGICGYLALDGKPLGPSDEVVRRMNAMLFHRGPDQAGYHLEPNIHLGVRRLSIQDLEGGSQPVYNEDRSVVVIFNGEIYNFKELRKDLLQKGHVFKSRCDTEVLVHLYEEHGPDFLDQLNGQFAFALWDVKQRRLMLARDRVGKKPLFYTIAGGRLVFASEIKSILLHPGVERAVDYRCLDQTFTFFMPVNPRTMFRGIFNLPPGRMIDVRDGDLQVRKYWEPSFPDLRQVPRVPDGELVEKFRELLEDSVRFRLIADVPVGVFVSGGIDSCVIAYLAKQLSGRRIRTYSIGHESDYYDESKYSDLMAQVLQSDHHKLMIRPEQIAEGLAQLVWRVEAPSCKTSCAAYMLLYQLARQSSTVVLTGEGADEALGGYPNIRMLKVLDFCRRHPALTRSSKLMEKVLPPGSTLRVMYHEPTALSPDDEAEVQRQFGCVPVDLQRYRSLSALKSSLYSDACRDALRGYSAESEMAEKLVNKDLLEGRHFVQQAQYFEYLLKLPNYLLINPGDRAAMTHSVENRCPFLDHRLIEFCTALPPRLRVRGLTEKHILRKAFEGRIPTEILHRSKRPFTTIYVSSIFRHDKTGYLDDAVSESAVTKAGLFRYSAVEEMKRRLLAADLSMEEQVKLETPFSLVVTAQLWHRMFIEDFRTTGPTDAHAM